MTSAARSIRLRDRPCATPASVFIEHGTIAMPLQPWLPLAIVAPRSRLLWTVSEPAATSSPYFSVRNGISRVDRRRFAELVAQQPAAVVGNDQLDVHASRQQRRDRSGRVDRAARAGDGDGDGLSLPAP